MLWSQPSKRKMKKIKNKAIAAQEKKVEKQKRKKTTSRQKGIISKKQKVTTTVSDGSNKATDEQAGEGKDSCLYYNGLFAEDKNDEDWCMCMFCHRWTHDECAWFDSDDDEYVCTFCS